MTIFLIVCLIGFIASAITNVILDQPEEESEEKELHRVAVVKPESFKIDFSPEDDSFTIKDIPGYYRYYNYDSFLSRTAELYESEFANYVAQLREQESDMILLRDGIQEVIRQLNPDIVNALDDYQYLLDHIFYAYDDNRFATIDNICEYVVCEENARDQQVEIIADIVHDNDVIITNVNNFYSVICEGLAASKCDDTATHITDLTYVNELKQLVKKLQASLDEDDCKYGDVPTLNTLRHARTLLGTNAKIQHSSTGDTNITEMPTSTMRESV